MAVTAESVEEAKRAVLDYIIQDPQGYFAGLAFMHSDIRIVRAVGDRHIWGVTFDFHHAGKPAVFRVLQKADQEVLTVQVFTLWEHKVVPRKAKVD